MLEELIKSKREECARKVREAKPELKEKDIDSLHWSIHMDSILSKRPSIAENEFLVWDYLVQKQYWRSIKIIEDVSALGAQNPFSEDDLKNIASIVIDQTMKGEAIAVGIPFYADIWELIGKKDGPLEKYVTKEHKVAAVNIGFWDLLKRTADPQKQESCTKVLTEIMQYEKFFNYFDFNEGVKKAEEMPDEINLSQYFNLNIYMRWYLVQETNIRSQLERKKADEVCGKLAAPIIYCMLVESDLERDRQNKMIMNYFLTAELIKGKAVQNVLGKVFEMGLESLLTNEYESPWEISVLEMCERALENSEAHASAVWKEVKEKVNLSKIPNGVKKYVPKEAFEGYISGLRAEAEKIESMNVEILRKWMGLKIGKDVPKSLHSRVTNKMLNVYYFQKSRPNKDLLRKIDSCTGIEKRADKFNGFLFSDFLLRHGWPEANNILKEYDRYGPLIKKPLKDFNSAVSEYVKMHGKIRLDERGLNERACYPEYNRIIDFKKEFPGLFR
jgi:hypothetical protein